MARAMSNVCTRCDMTYGNHNGDICESAVTGRALGTHFVWVEDSKALIERARNTFGKEVDHMVVRHVNDVADGDVIYGCTQQYNGGVYSAWSKIVAGSHRYSRAELRSGWSGMLMLVKLAGPGAVKVADPGRYPHRCPSCRRPVYIGFTSIEHERTGSASCG